MFNAALLWRVKKVIVGTLQEALYLWSKYRLLLSPEDSAAFFAVHRLHARATRLSPCLSRSWGQIMWIMWISVSSIFHQEKDTPPHPTPNLQFFALIIDWCGQLGPDPIYDRGRGVSQLTFVDTTWGKTTVQLWFKFGHGLFSLFSLHLCDDAQAVFDSHKTTV